jgi:hypothetical protein
MVCGACTVCTEHTKNALARTYRNTKIIIICTYECYYEIITLTKIDNSRHHDIDMCTTYTPYTEQIRKCEQQFR